jgi:hypothetical protein
MNSVFSAGRIGFSIFPPPLNLPNPIALATWSASQPLLVRSCEE